MSNLLGYLQSIIGPWSPGTGSDIDWVWLAGALILAILLWGTFRIILVLFHIIGGGKS